MSKVLVFVTRFCIVMVLSLANRGSYNCNPVRMQGAHWGIFRANALFCNPSIIHTGSLNIAGYE